MAVAQHIHLPLQVSGLDALVHANEMRALFESAGPVTQVVTLSPSAAGGEAAVLIWFASPASAQTAVDLFNDHPHAGTFLEVKMTDAAAAGRALAALSEVQTAAPGSGARPAHMLRTDSASLAAAAAAGPAVTFPGGASVPMPAPFAGGAPTAVPAVPAAPASAPASATASAIPSGAATPEPPVFGGPDFNPEEWAVPTDWKPPTAAAAVAAAAPAPALAAKPAAGKAAAKPGVPVWETDSRCRIFIQGLRPGCSADDLKSYFSRFGPLVDMSVVPKQHIGFLTFAKPEDGEACLNAVHNTSVPGLSPSGSEPLRLEFRDLDKIQRHMAKTAQRPDVMSTPTTRVFIGYFPRSTKRRDVEIELERYGEVREVILGGGTDGGELYCFVQYRRVQDAAAMYKAVHGHAIPTLAGGRKLVCAFKEPRGR